VSTAPPIVFERASRWYGSVIGLNDVSVTIAPGVVGLLGPNGAGKSTFLRLAAGQIPPNHGRVSVFGRPAWGTPAVLQRVGLCPETDGFFETQTGVEFVAGLLRLNGFDAAEARRRAQEALAQVRLESVQDRRVGGYSKGMRQRLKLAQALAHDPDLLLLDEPLNGLDPVNRRHVVDLVKALGRAGKTVLVSSHVLHEVEAMTRRIVLIHKGRVLAEGEVGEIRALLDAHPHTVAVRARAVRALARELAALPHVRSLNFGAEGEWVTVQTVEPEALYDAVQQHGAECGVSELYATDEDLESVFRYLVPR
jgi:ABC-2 type transport system ATP-binding protein